MNQFSLPSLGNSSNNFRNFVSGEDVHFLQYSFHFGRRRDIRYVQYGGKSGQHFHVFQHFPIVNIEI